MRARRVREQGVYVTPRHFVDMVNQFVSVYNEKKGQIEGQQLHLSVGLRKLSETHGDVQTLAQTLAQRETELLTKEQQANEKLQQMVEDQREAEKSKERTHALRAEVAETEREIEKRRVTVRAELAEAEPAVEEAKSAVQGIKRTQLDEVCVFVSASMYVFVEGAHA